MQKINYQDFKQVQELHHMLQEIASFDAQGKIVKINSEQKLQEEIIWQLQYTASVHENPEIKKEAINIINAIAYHLKLEPSSNYVYYGEKAEGKNLFATTPAINCRMLTFHTVRAALLAYQQLKLPHIVFELALSEQGYTGQKIDEYASLVKAAYISCGFKNTKIYLQGDHYQADPKKYAENPEQEIQRIKEVIKSSIEQGVYNIDIDTSKFETADPNKTPKENQAMNAKLTAEFLYYIRSLEKEMIFPCIISVGGEVGEVGSLNTKFPEVNGYLALLYEEMFQQIKKDPKKNIVLSGFKGLSKVSINVGSAHGGQLGPDGKPLDNVPLDFQAHHDLFMQGKDPFNPGKHIVTVQHGASTLPKHYFALFPAMHVGEIHLATGFQNITWDVIEQHEPELHKRMKKMVFEKFADKVKSHPTEAVGFNKERKHITQFFKKELLTMKPKTLEALELALSKEFTDIMHSLYVLLLPKQANC